MFEISLTTQKQRCPSTMSQVYPFICPNVMLVLSLSYRTAS